MPDNGAKQMSEEEVTQEAIKLWTRYLSLAKELLKFINKEDIDTFMLVAEHREQLFKEIQALPSTEYRKTKEFRALGEQILPLDREMMYKARGWLTRSRRQNSVVRSYDLDTALAMNESFNFNKKY
jgi:hypothetical protein